MKRGRIVTAGLALALGGVFATTGALVAQDAGQPAPQVRQRHPGPGGPFGGPMGLALPLGRLDLTDAQHEQVRAIMQTHRDELRATAEQLRAAHKAQDDAVTAVPFDEGTIRERMSALAAIQSDAAVLRARVHSEVWAVLTPEQQAKAKEIEAEREKRMSEVRERVRERVQPRRQRPQA
jgi:Spy/CpxP family protein refolding chaperone